MHAPPASCKVAPLGDDAGAGGSGSGDAGGTILGDIVIARPVGKLVSIPATCPLEGVEYHAVAKEGSVYK